MADSCRKTITYFEKPGKQNTEELMQIVAERMKEGDLKSVAVATTSGATALKAAQALPSDTCIFAVNFQSAYWDKHQRPEPGIQKQAEGLGVVFMPDQPTARYLREIADDVPKTLRRMGQGMKVAVEVVMQAGDVGRISAGDKVVGVGGSSRGADVAIVALAAGSDDFSSFWVSEILAKPL